MTLSNIELIRGNRNFRNLLIGQYISELGNWFNYVAGLGLVTYISGGSAKVAGVLLLCRTLPWSLLMPFAGTLVDRVSRRKLMIITDLLRVGAALIFILVREPEDLWIAYGGSILMSTIAAFFDGAKSSAMPNLVGKEGLLSGTALMFSSRFLLMGLGGFLGGLAIAQFGYNVAFIINSISFLISAYSIWLIPEEAIRGEETRKSEASFMDDVREGMNYAFRNPFILTIVLMNVIWAIGGGATNLIANQLGGVYFAAREGWNQDTAMSFLLGVSGLGLFFGTVIAHRVGSYLEYRKWTTSFIGWTLIIHGVLFGIAGYMPSLLLVGLLFFISRLIVGVEYAVQETLFFERLPNYIRGRIATLDRGIEITMFSISTGASIMLLDKISIQMLTLISGLISGSSGILWFWRMRGKRELSDEAIGIRP